MTRVVVGVRRHLAPPRTTTARDDANATRIAATDVMMDGWMPTVGVRRDTIEGLDASPSRSSHDSSQSDSHVDGRDPDVEGRPPDSEGRPSLFNRDSSQRDSTVEGHVVGWMDPVHRPSIASLDAFFDRHVTSRTWTKTRRVYVTDVRLSVHPRCIRTRRRPRPAADGSSRQISSRASSSTKKRTNDERRHERSRASGVRACARAFIHSTRVERCLERRRIESKRSSTKAGELISARFIHSFIRSHSSTRR